MDEMGPVNTEAISEYDELENRLKFLETEEKDLTTAKAQLEEAIRKINQTTRLLFEETFDKVRVSFGTLFGELFGGGRATVVHDPVHPPARGDQLRHLGGRRRPAGQARGPASSDGRGLT